jgi:hypothetical protein
MARRVFFGVGVLAVLPAAVLLSGCGGESGKGGTTVKGKLVSDGTPLEVNDGTAAGSMNYIRVSIALVKGDKSFDAVEVKPDGTFSIEGVEPGDGYTFTVSHIDRSMAQNVGPQKQDGPRPGAGGGPGGPQKPSGGTGAGRPTPNMDRLKDEFNATSSKIKVNVGKTSPQDLGTIDLKKPDTWPK